MDLIKRLWAKLMEPSPTPIRCYVCKVSMQAMPGTEHKVVMEHMMTPEHRLAWAEREGDLPPRSES